MIERLQHKYALSEKGTKDMLRAFVAVTIANLVLMLPVGLLYYLASYLLEGDVPRAKIPFFTVSIIVVLILIAASTVFQYVYFLFDLCRKRCQTSYFSRKTAQDPAVFLW